MFLVKYSSVLLTLVWYAETKPANIFVRPIEVAGNAFNELANVSLGVVKTAFDAVETGIDSALETRDIVVSRIRDGIEGFRKQMASGFEEFGIPKLDPLEIKHIEFNVNHEIGKFNGTVDNVKVEDLALFQINNLVYNLPLKVNLNLTFPTVRVSGRYNINGNIGDMFYIHGKGPFEFTVFNVTAQANTTLEYNQAHFQMKNLSLDIQLKRMESHFHNLMGGGKNEQLFNKVIEDLAPVAVEMLWPELKPIVTERVKKVFQVSIIPKRIIRYTNKLTNLFSIRRIFGMLG